MVKKQTIKCQTSSILFCGKVISKKKYLKAFNSSQIASKIN